MGQPSPEGIHGNGPDALRRDSVAGGEPILQPSTEVDKMETDGNVEAEFFGDRALVRLTHQPEHRLQRDLVAEADDVVNAAASRR